MSGSWGDNDLSPGEASTRLLGSQVASQAAGNLLWRGAKSVAGELWDLAQVPGRVWSGDLSPYPSGPGPGQHALDVPQYATNLALTGMGVGNLLGGAGEGVARQFGAWHGTGAAPFSEFSDDYIGTGQGAASYGWGHYVAGARKVGENYREEMAGRDLVPLGEDGVPLTDLEKLHKYFEPGMIVPSYGGFDKVISFNQGPEPYSDWPRWSVSVREVVPDLNKEEAGIMGRQRGDNYNFMLGRPDLWKDVGHTRNHSTYPERQDISSVGEARGWQMGQPGGLLHINVIPEENELLDWDLPWSKQDPEIREQMIKARLDPMSISENAGYGDAWAFRNDDPTGGDMYRQMTQNYHDKGEFEDFQKMVSQDLDAAGIPGLKYKDQSSRGMTDQPTLKHINDYEGAPDHNLVQHYLKDFPIYGRSLDEDINIITNQLRVEGGDRIRDLDKFDDVLRQNLTPGEVDDLRQRSMSYHDMADWVEKEHKEGNFRVGSNLTRNYVIFDPKNLEIKTWNGRKLEPVEHDPFDIMRP